MWVKWIATPPEQEHDARTTMSRWTWEAIILVTPVVCILVQPPPTSATTPSPFTLNNHCMCYWEDHCYYYYYYYHFNCYYFHWIRLHYQPVFRCMSSHLSDAVVPTRFHRDWAPNGENPRKSLSKNEKAEPAQFLGTWKALQNTLNNPCFFQKCQKFIYMPATSTRPEIDPHDASTNITHESRLFCQSTKKFIDNDSYLVFLHHHPSLTLSFTRKSERKWFACLEYLC